MPSDKRARQRAARQAKVAAEQRVRKRNRLLRNGAIALVIALVVGGTAYLIAGRGSSTTTTTTTTSKSTSTSTAPSTPTAKEQAAANKVAVAAGCPASPASRVNTLTFPAAPTMTIDPAKTYRATVTTTAGPFVITLDPKAAPQTVNNFVFLADKGFYRCVIFHRVIPGFVDQTGDPTGTGNGGPGYTIPDEFPPAAANGSAQYPLGSVAMANTGAAHSGGSQWFVIAGPQGEALPNKYSDFGQVTSGMPVVQTINAAGSTSGVPPRVTQRILSVTVSES